MGSDPQQASPGGERRQVERRRGADRRGRDPLERRRRADTPDESWFGALGVEADTAFHDDFDRAVPPRRAAPRQAPDFGEDTRAMSREALRVAVSPDTALRRIHRTYLTARAALGLALLGIALAAQLLGTGFATLPLVVCAVYALQSIGVWAWQRRTRNAADAPMQQLSKAQWALSIGADLLAFSALHLLAPAATLNYAALLVLPVLMAGVMTPRLAALGTASGVTLLLLAAAWRAAGPYGDATLALMQAGLAGIGMFVVALLAGELSGRLAREELAARGSLELARQQAQLNKLVLEEMSDGVMVVDRRARVRAANPAALELLASSGAAQPAPFDLDSVPSWQGLLGAVQRAFEAGLWPSDAHELSLHFDDGHRRTLQVRARFTRRRGLDDDTAPPEEFCVLFLEDMRSVQARLRQDKLAAMGRVSAGIAHEIRNPLAAIAQANALMLEDELPGTQRRLAVIVADNVERLKRIVDDVMEVAPGAAPVSQVIDATAHVAALCTDWARTVQLPLGPHSRLAAELPTQALGVVFDPEHLRRVLVNLLDNARRHGSAEPGAIVLRLAAFDGEQALLSVASDGDPIPAEVERHLFEPFFSTRSRGTGLGLYICRELCERYGARIDYRLRGGVRHHNEFIVAMQRAPLAVVQGTVQARPT